MLCVDSRHRTQSVGPRHKCPCFSWPASSWHLVDNIVLTESTVRLNLLLQCSCTCRNLRVTEVLCCIEFVFNNLLLSLLLVGLPAIKWINRDTTEIRSACSWSICLPGWHSPADGTSEVEIHSFHNVGNGFLIMLWATGISCDFSEPPDLAPPPHGPAHIATPTSRDLNLISRYFAARHVMDLRSFSTVTLLCSLSAWVWCTLHPEVCRGNIQGPVNLWPHSDLQLGEVPDDVSTVNGIEGKSKCIPLNR
jgi:hypothetical protein